MVSLGMWSYDCTITHFKFSVLMPALGAMYSTLVSLLPEPATLKAAPKVIIPLAMTVGVLSPWLLISQTAGITMTIYTII